MEFCWVVKTQVKTPVFYTVIPRLDPSCWLQIPANAAPGGAAVTAPSWDPATTQKAHTEFPVLAAAWFSPATVDI